MTTKRLLKVSSWLLIPMFILAIFAAIFSLLYAMGSSVVDMVNMRHMIVFWSMIGAVVCQSIGFVTLMSVVKYGDYIDDFKKAEGMLYDKTREMEYTRDKYSEAMGKLYNATCQMESAKDKYTKLIKELEYNHPPDKTREQSDEPEKKEL